MISLDRSSFVTYRENLGVVKLSGGLYPVVKGQKAIRYLHRELTRAPKGLVVDHLDGNTCNNLQSNLRVCTQRENSQNRTVVRRDNRLGVLGVSKVGKRFRARKSVNGVSRFLGSFATLQEATDAYNAPSPPV